MLIAAAAGLEDDILILDEPTDHLDLAKNINTLKHWLTVDFSPMLIITTEILDPVTKRTLFLRSDGVHAFATRFSVGARGAAAPRRDRSSRASSKEKEIKRLEQPGRTLQGYDKIQPDLDSARTPSKHAFAASRPAHATSMSRASGGSS